MSVTEKDKELMAMEALRGRSIISIGAWYGKAVPLARMIVERQCELRNPKLYRALCEESLFDFPEMSSLRLHRKHFFKEFE